jgi:prevent-host-death family protein
MRTATVRELRNHYNTLLDWVAEGEEVVITKRGKSVARLVPEAGETGEAVDWSASPVVLRDRSNEKMMTNGQLRELWDNLDG